MPGHWYWRNGDQQQGPLSEEEFEGIRRSGQIRSGDLVWHSSWADWRPYDASSAQEVPRPPPLPHEHPLLPHAPSTPLGAFAGLLREHLTRLGIPWEEKDEYQYVMILTDLLKSAQPKPANGLAREVDLAEEFYAAETLANSAAFAFSHGEDEFSYVLGFERSERPKQLWRHRDVGRVFREGLSSTEVCPPVAEIANVARTYLNQHLRSPTLEYLLVDALVAAETSAFGEELKKRPSSFENTDKAWSNPLRGVNETLEYGKANGNADKLIWIRYKRQLLSYLKWRGVLLGLPLVIAAFAAQQNMPAMAIVAASIAAVVFAFLVVRYFWWLLRKLLRLEPQSGLQRSIALWGKMAEAYSQLEGGTASSPKRIREVLSKVSDEGAVWDGAVFALLDTAIMRSSGSWS